MALVSIPRKGRCFVRANAFQVCALEGRVRGDCYVCRDTEFSAQQPLAQVSDPPSLLSVCTMLLLSGGEAVGAWRSSFSAINFRIHLDSLNLSN